MTANPDGGADCGCPDYSLSRRSLLRAGTVAGAAGAATSMVGDVLTSAVFGAESRGNVLVVLSQRGGVDGMSMVVPHGEPAYYRARPSIAVAKGRLLHRDHTFGLHPALAPLSGLWKDERLAAVHAVGLPLPNRSHFDALEQVEDADPGSSLRIGWLNRVVGALGRDSSLFEGVQLGSNVLPTSLVGPQATVALASPAEIGTPYAGTEVAPALKAGLQQMYAGPGATRAAGRRALQLARQGGHVADVAARGPRHRARYPASPLGTSLRDAAALIRSGVGVRAIAVDSGGWDHHVGLNGAMQTGLGDLASSVAAFFTDLGPESHRVTLVTMSEFGRRLAENGAAGLDHGYGNAVLVAGAGVRGRRYYARWPGLGDRRLVDGDLAVTTDVRHVLGEIVRSRFPGVDTADIFPGAGYRRVGFMR